MDVRVPSDTTVTAAHQVCPYTNATRGNVNVGLTLA
jgi:lipoyl-dependent peroxiredoxin